MRVYKYTLPFPDSDGNTQIDLPKGSRILNVGLQNGDFVLWALVSSMGVNAPEVLGNVTRRLYIVNTGTDFGYTGNRQSQFDNLKFITTLTADAAEKKHKATGIVWHVFEVT